MAKRTEIEKTKTWRKVILSLDFTRAALEACAEMDFGRFRSRIAEDGSALPFAKRRLNTQKTTAGFDAATDTPGRWHYTVEALALQPRFQELFSELQLDTARKRLLAAGVSPEELRRHMHRMAE